MKDMQLFYSPDIAAGSFCTLDADESRHAVRVLRMRAGDVLHVTDGRGALYACRVVEADDRACLVQAGAEAAARRAAEPALHLLVAPTKNPARMEWMVEKAVEVGVGRVTLLQCEHSERAFLKTDRLQRVALSAMKQSLHLTLPAIGQAVPLREWLGSAAAGSDRPLRLIAHCEAGQPRTPLGDALQAGRDTEVLIGPEGDFSESEIGLALQAGFSPVSLGPSRLRTETAALYAAVAFNLINDRTK